ncbi:MAG: CDP-alcohol phosphatidyltransferase family protein [Acidimicrobiia bacterium]
MAVDPSALVTWANGVTVGRMLVSPILFVVIPGDARGSWLAAWLWFFLCWSDVLDGYLARRHGATTLGAFLDPLSDKVLVLGAMFTLVQRDVFPAWPVIVIAVREVAVQVYRVVVGARGVSVPASRTAKVKTLAQQCSVGFALAPFSAADATWTWGWLLGLSVALTIASGLQYAVRALRPRRAAA